MGPISYLTPALIPQSNNANSSLHECVQTSTRELLDITACKERKKYPACHMSSVGHNVCKVIRLHCFCNSVK